MAGGTLIDTDKNVNRLNITRNSSIILQGLGYTDTDKYKFQVTIRCQVSPKTANNFL